MTNCNAHIHLDTVAVIKAWRAINAEEESRITVSDMRVGIETYLREAAENKRFLDQMFEADKAGELER